VWARLPSGAAVLAGGGLQAADRRAAEEFYPRTLAGASLDVHGIVCGEPGAVKTNLPAEATATLSLRVAPGQAAASLADTLGERLARSAPTGATVEIERLAVAEPALVDPKEPRIRTCAAAVERATGWRAEPVRSGGTLPIMAALAARSIPTFLSGFALPDDGIHGPDERLRVEHLELGTVAAMAILEDLGA
jgi:acetylornithine deacetylase/succinyl-diaminopimelate desuccinylase-like protein